MLTHNDIEYVHSGLHVYDNSLRGKVKQLRGFGSQHLATVSVIGLQNKYINKQIIFKKKPTTPIPSVSTQSYHTTHTNNATIFKGSCVTYPGLCTISLKTLTASSLLMFSKLMSFT